MINIYHTLKSICSSVQNNFRYHDPTVKFKMIYEFPFVLFPIMLHDVLQEYTGDYLTAVFINDPYFIHAGSYYIEVLLRPLSIPFR